MSAHIDSLEILFNRLEGMDSTVSHSMQVATLLASFGSTQECPYGSRVTALQTVKDEDLTWEKATARLLQEYYTRQALLKKSRSGRSSAPNKQELSLKSKAQIQCYKCGKFGHYKGECRSKPKYDKKLDVRNRRFMDNGNADHVRQRKQAWHGCELRSEFSHVIRQNHGARRPTTFNYPRGWSYCFWKDDRYSRLEHRGEDKNPKEHCSE